MAVFYASQQTICGVATGLRRRLKLSCAVFAHKTRMLLVSGRRSASIHGQIDTTVIPDATAAFKVFRTFRTMRL